MFEVVKLGGSLLNDAGWPARFARWRREGGEIPAVLIVGGGEMVEAMRQLDTVHSLDNTAMHWRCVRMLRHTTDVAAEILQRSGVDFSLLTTLAEFAEFVGGTRHGLPAPPTLAIAYADAVYRSDFFEALARLPEQLRQHFCRDREPPLPRVGWQTTSDAIAIHLAAWSGAARCVILKSCEVDCYHDLADAAAAGVVDPETPRLATDYPRVSLVRL